ncbi:hypothetical protein HDF26_000860 [Pedobacter cryoconitis]|uniref:SnoaL-like domain-containing protein n=1 Tax=Pedobacter cryoconitis TaxID=188932 RepID=A0A7W8ZPJ5_9SPHI|nr:SnoaL-like domain-containing protein [Pedobacter cryoconitis]MBB5637811.1 hypothetical protein [Pedobacter cryoconitis]MBB6270433.1 hypothetical protein [Pedobacter cryoconitis]
MNTQEVALKFIQLWREGRNDEAIKEFYPDTKSNHVPGFLYTREMKHKNGMEISDPLVIGEFFCFRLKMNVILKDIGESALNESWVFEVQKNKIVYERFFNCNTKQILV